MQCSVLYCTVYTVQLYLLYRYEYTQAHGRRETLLIGVEIPWILSPSSLGFPQSTIQRLTDEARSAPNAIRSHINLKMWCKAASENREENSSRPASNAWRNTRHTAEYILGFTGDRSLYIVSLYSACPYYHNNVKRTANSQA